MDTDRDLLFGVLALKAGLIDAEGLAVAIAARAAGGPARLADLLVARGSITPSDRADIEGQVDLLLRGRAGGPAAGLAETVAEVPPGGPGSEGPGAGPMAETLPAEVDSSNEETQGRPVRSSAETLQAASAHVLVSTLGDDPNSRERYTLTRLHATGGIGRVWLARDPEFGREVALKELRPESARDPGIWARFLEEARITGQLEHPGIVPVYELKRGEPDRAPFYTMRFVAGRTLTEASRAYHAGLEAGTATALDRQTLLNAFVGVCNAISYAHARGVLHRDLKGQNVVLGDYGEVIVLDWGLAKVIDGPDSDAAPGPGGVAGATPVVLGDEDSHPPTIRGAALGTPAYMPPEQAAGRFDLVDRRSDVYGLGAILYEILTGRMPFAGSSTSDILRKVQEEEPTPPRQVVPGTPPALEAICRKAMAKRPEARYASAKDLAAEVSRWLADEPVLAYPEPWTTRAVRWGRHHRPAVAGAAALLVAGVVALSIGTVLVGRERDEARRQRDEATRQREEATARRNEARLQRQQARRAVDDMYTKVAVNWLEDRLDPLQREFLDQALGYYEGFAGQEADEPSARQERGRAYQRAGDIYRKLGKPAEAEKALRRASEILGSLAAETPEAPEIRQDWARAQARLALVLFDTGKPREAEPLHRRAVGLLEPMAAGKPAPPRSALELAETLKALADLLRYLGRNPEAEASYRQAVKALGGESRTPGTPVDLESHRLEASALDRLGLLLRETGRLDEARAAYERELKILEALAAEAPALPGPREALANALRSLGLFHQQAGRTPEALAMLRRALDVTKALSADFPARPDYRRDLAKGHVNLGQLLARQGNPQEAEPEYARAAALYEALVVEVPGVVQYRQDLARTLNNVGLLMKMTGRLAEAEKAIRRAVEVYEALAADVPGVPGYRQALASSRSNLANLLAATDRAAEAEAIYRKAWEILGRLADEAPDVPDHRREMARVLVNLGNLERRLDRGTSAAHSFRSAVSILEKLVERFPAVPEYRSELAICLNSLAGLRATEAEVAYRRSLAILGKLAAEAPAEASHRRLLGIVRNNLGEYLRDTDRHADAERAFREAGELLEALAAEAPALAEIRSNLGVALGNLGALRLALGAPAEARRLLERAAVEHRAAIATNPRGVDSRRALRDHLAALAKALLTLGDHAEAARAAAEILKVATDRPGARRDAARVLARCVPLAEGDTKLADGPRQALADGYADRAIALLREAIERGDKGGGRLDEDADLASLRSRDAFRKLLTPPNVEATRAGDAPR